MPGPKFIHPDALAKAKRLYEETNLPVADISALLDVNPTTLYRRAVLLGWKLRRKHRTQAVPNDVLLKHGAEPIDELRSSSECGSLAPHASDEDASLGPVAFDEDDVDAACVTSSDFEMLAARVEEAAKLQAIRVERILRLEGSAEAETRRGERAARTLASLAQTLATLRRAMKLNRTSEVAEDEILSDADIRRELAAALERIAPGDPDAVSGEPESSGP